MGPFLEGLSDEGLMIYFGILVIWIHGMKSMSQSLPENPLQLHIRELICFA